MSATTKKVFNEEYRDRITEQNGLWCDGLVAWQAGERFYARYKDWVDMNNALVEQFGIPGQEHRPW